MFAPGVILKLLHIFLWFKSHNSSTDLNYFLITILEMHVGTRIFKITYVAYIIYFLHMCSLCSSARLLGLYFAHLFYVHFTCNFTSFPVIQPATSPEAPVSRKDQVSRRDHKHQVPYSPPLWWPEHVCHLHQRHFITQLPAFSSCVGDIRYLTSGKGLGKVARWVIFDSLSDVTT